MRRPARKPVPNGPATLMRALLGAVLAALAGLTAAASAQGFDVSPRGSQNPPCVLDKCLNPAAAPEPPADGDNGAVGRSTPTVIAQSRPNGPVGTRAPGAFDFYVLALSWSPGFCDTGGDSKAPSQCADGANLGFVVHGLWPQNQHGYPSNCDAGSRFPSRAALDQVRGLYPDDGLARHEWRQHGTCTGLSPTDYFGQVRRARDAVAIPPSLQAPHDPQTMAPLDIARAFTEANAGLRADMMAVTCRQGELEEVRLCFTKDLRGFTTCPEISQGSCRTRQISVLPER